jgi:hypothetical protein
VNGADAPQSKTHGLSWDKTLALRLGFAPQLEGSGGEQKFVIVVH